MLASLVPCLARQGEVLDDRVGSRSTLITSQLPVKAWHTYLDDPKLADAILDRVVHSSHKIALKGVSLHDPEQDEPVPVMWTPRSAMSVIHR